MKRSFDLDSFVRERNEALFSFNAKRIIAFMNKSEVSIPERPEVFWGTVAKAVLGITNAPPEAREKAKRILDDLGMDYTIE